MTVDIEKLVAWKDHGEKNTSKGPKILWKAAVTEAFWEAWRAAKAQLKAAGVSCSKDDRTGRWEVCWWRPIAAEIAEKRNAAIEQSKAVDTDIEIPCPDGLAYRPFQRAGIAYAMSRQGTLIADEMGLGKTIQAIGVINADPKISQVLIVCPATLKLNWFNELSKWLTRRFTIGIADSKCWPTTSIVIINFDILVKWPKRLATYWDLIIIDEAQRVKNRKAKRTQALFGYQPSRKEDPSLAKAPLSARRKICLTGTPIENNPDEAWTLLNFLDPERWPKYWSFVSKYCGVDNNGFGVKVGSGKNLDQLQRTLRETIMIRRLKADVLKELPPKTRSIVLMDASAYPEILLRERGEVSELEELEIESELAKMDDDATFEEKAKALTHKRDSRMKVIATLRHDTALAKVTKLGLADIIAEEARELGKLIVFAHHKDVLDVLEQAFKPHEVVRIDGDVEPNLRQGIVDRFQKDPGTICFLGSIRACGEGITLTASSNVFFVEEDWTPGRMCQAEDRAHRIGQRDSVNVRHYVVNGSLDARMVQTIIRKLEIIDKAMDRSTVYDVADSPVSVIEADPATVKIEKTTRESHRITREQVVQGAAVVTQENHDAVLLGLRMIAGVCNGARDLDGCGFSKFDTRIGKEMANLPSLTRNQVAYGARLVNKYRRQLPEEVVHQATNGIIKRRNENEGEAS